MFVLVWDPIHIKIHEIIIFKTTPKKIDLLLVVDLSFPNLYRGRSVPSNHGQPSLKFCILLVFVCATFGETKLKLTVCNRNVPMFES